MDSKDTAQQENLITVAPNVSVSDINESSSKVEVEVDKNQDASILEYCPKIFREIRKVDVISPDILAE